jgi:aminopeptidase-like protein
MGRAVRRTDPVRDGAAVIDRAATPSPEEAGREIHDLMVELWPLPRSLTGNGLRQTLELVSGRIPLELVETPSGTEVFDWKLPREWNVREAWIADPSGRRVVDFADSTLHLLHYSTPVRARLPLAELREHLFTHPEHRDRIPYRTSYYREAWGFCLTQDALDALPEGEYEVCIDSSLLDGNVTYGEGVARGESEDEVLLSTYACHPALANDNVSGVALVAVLGKYLAEMPLRLTYRFLFGPGTIGPLTWLWRNEERLDRIKHGLVLSSAGDPGGLTYKRSRRGNAEIDRAAALALRESGGDHRILDWIPWGGDERQFGSPGFDLPVGALSRTPADQFPEYHSSADDLDFVRPEFLGDTFRFVLDLLDVLEGNGTYVNLRPKGEPQLGKRGLYRSTGGGSTEELALLWVLNQSDGGHDLLEIASRSGLPFQAVRQAATQLLDADLLAPA